LSIDSSSTFPFSSKGVTIAVVTPYRCFIPSAPL
jgi:hypothetical protein